MCLISGKEEAMLGFAGLSRRSERRGRFRSSSWTSVEGPRSLKGKTLEEIEADFRGVRVANSRAR
jgi:hypothetical protein